MGIGWTLLKALAVYEGSITVKENIERHKHFNDARAYCDQVGKPLLVVGMKRHSWQPPDGDVTVDIDPAVEQVPGGIRADIRDLPFGDKTFGAVYCIPDFSCVKICTLEGGKRPSQIEVGSDYSVS